jgi:Base plate wedge protein 53
MSRYFENFGIGQYNGEYCRMLTTRTAIAQDVVKLTSAFYPYQLVEGERPDTISNLYYKDPSLEWLVFFANDIIDPYYGWYLTNEQFTQYVIDKYGSLANAQLKVHHFQVNWVGDDTKLTIAAYDALPSVYPANTKQYWRPLLDEYGATVCYVRKQLDNTTTTNLVMNVGVASSDGFNIGELISQEVGGIVSGYGEIVAINDNALIIKHVLGTFTTGYPVVGFTSSANSSVSSTNVLTHNIPSEELIYWRSISCYDYEEYLNEQRKVLKLIDSGYAEAAQDNLKTMMK